MLKESIKQLRTARGMSQEQLAERLHVVRQTISKWETGLSVPDAEQLLRLSEVFEVTVGELLGETPPPAPDTPDDELRRIAEQLSDLNARLAIRAARTRRNWRIAAYTLLGLAALLLLIEGVEEILVWYLLNPSIDSTSLGIIGGADGPTSVFVTCTSSPIGGPVLLALLLAICGGGILWKTRET